MRAWFLALFRRWVFMQDVFWEVAAALIKALHPSLRCHPGVKLAVKGKRANKPVRSLFLPLLVRHDCNGLG